MKTITIKETKQGWTFHNKGFNDFELIGLFTVLRDNEIIEILNKFKRGVNLPVKPEK